MIGPTNMASLIFLKSESQSEIEGRDSVGARVRKWECKIGLAELSQLSMKCRITKIWQDGNGSPVVIIIHCHNYALLPSYV